MKKCVASGRGLHTAVVKQIAQFTITTHDENGLRRLSGGDTFTVSVRSVLPPANLRFRLHDLKNGTYTGEYKAEAFDPSVDYTAAAAKNVKPAEVTVKVSE